MNPIYFADISTEENQTDVGSSSTVRDENIQAFAFAVAKVIEAQIRAYAGPRDKSVHTRIRLDLVKE